MARYTGPRVRISRRIGFNVFENKKGDKALQDRPYPPGENGRKRVRETDYGTQLKEKQKVNNHKLRQQVRPNLFQLNLIH